MITGNYKHFNQTGVLTGLTGNIILAQSARQCLQVSALSDELVESLTLS